MKIKDSYIVEYNSNFQMLYECCNGKWFMTSNGAFNQREMYITEIGIDTARELISFSIKH